MNPSAPASTKEMLSRLPASVRTTFEAMFHTQVEAAYVQQLNDELATIQAQVPQLPTTTLKDEVVLPKVEVFPPTATTAAAALTAAANAAMSWKAPATSITPIKQEWAASSSKQGKRKTPDKTTHNNNDAALAAAAPTGKTNDDSIVIDDDPDLDNTPKQADLSLLKGEHGLQIIRADKITRHLFLLELDLQVVQLMLEPTTP
jgi:hypothetical protein